MAQAQLVTSFYVPWARARRRRRPTAARSARAALHLSVGYDRTSAGVSEEVTCSVEAERRGDVGRGMLLAEVGLPPGADVDRASLDRAMEESGWTLNRYDVLPDRLVVYLWPHTGDGALPLQVPPALRPQRTDRALTALRLLQPGSTHRRPAHTLRGTMKGK